MREVRKSVAGAWISGSAVVLLRLYIKRVCVM